MFKTISRNIFVLCALSFTLSTINLSAQSRADEPSVGGSSKKAGKTRTYKKARVLQSSTAKKVVKIVEFGAFVNFLGAKDGLLHVSQISQERVANVADVLSEGQEVQVKVLDVDRSGKVKLSMKEV